MQHLLHTQRSGGSSRRVTGAVAVVIGIVLAAVGMSAGPSLAYTGPEILPSTSESNHPSYWGEDCSKLDEGGGTSWTADADYGIVVLKAGQFDWVYRDVEEGDVLEVGQNAISHFIFCPPTVTTTIPEETTTIPEETTTIPEETTTIPEETTTIPEETTTIPEETTTIPEETTTIPEETTTSVASQGPTTTVVETQQPTTTLVGSAAVTTSIVTELPATGSDLNRSLSVLGALLVVFGGVMLLTTRRPAEH